jgi:MipA family protein
MPTRKVTTTLVIGALVFPLAARGEANEANRLRVSVGSAAFSAPDYPGSEKQRALAVPLVTATYGRFFLGDAAGAGYGLGAELYRAGRWQFGTAFAVDGTRRREADDARLAGLGDVKETARAGMFGVYSGTRFLIRGSVMSDIGGENQGTLARLDSLAQFRPAAGFSLLAGPGLTWGNDRYAGTFFGVDESQSARSGLAQHEARSGIHSTRFSFAAQYERRHDWSVGAMVAFARLQGDAGDSPITADRSQTSGGLIASYRFD